MLLTNKQFAEYVGLRPTNLSTYFKVRKKFVYTDGGKIDIENPLNKVFIAERHKEIIASGKNPPTVEDITETRQVSGIKNSEANKLVKESLELKKERDRSSIDKLKKEVELLQLKADKMAGDIVPIEMVFSVIIAYSKSISHTMNVALNNVITQLGSELEMTNSQAGRFRNEVTEELNKAIEDAVADAKKSIKAIVKEYSDARGAGERE